MNMKNNISKYSHYFFVLFCLLLFLFSIQILRIPKGACNSSDVQLISQLHSKISNCCDEDSSAQVIVTTPVVVEPTTKPVEGADTIIDGVIVKEPVDDCRAHFSGLLMSDYQDIDWTSEIFVIDNASEYVGEGEYPRAIDAFPKSHAATFDGIAIDQRTRVIIYELPFFKGKILLDKVGPLIITNNARLDETSKWGGPNMTKVVTDNNNKIFYGDLNAKFPPNNRLMSYSNMIEWSKGSLKVICNE